MKNRSKKNKGLRLENFLVKVLRPTLDKDTYRVSASGSGIDKNDVRLPNWNIEIEAKNSSRFGLKAGLEQMYRQQTTGNIPILAMRHPSYPEFEKIVVALDLNDFVELLTRGNDVEIVQELPKELKWKAKKAKDSAHDFYKELLKYN